MGPALSSTAIYCFAGATVGVGVGAGVGDALALVGAGVGNWVALVGAGVGNAVVAFVGASVGAGVGAAVVVVVVLVEVIYCVQNLAISYSHGSHPVAIKPVEIGVLPERTA